MKQYLIAALKKITAKDVILQWSQDYNPDDIGDAVDHINLMRNRRMETGIYDAEYIENKMVDPQTILPKQVQKIKPKGWLKSIPEDQWADELNKTYDRLLKDRNFKEMLEMNEFDDVIVIEDELADGYGRSLLAFSLGEDVSASFFNGIYDEESSEYL